MCFSFNAGTEYPPTEFYPKNFCTENIFLNFAQISPKQNIPMKKFTFTKYPQNQISHAANQVPNHKHMFEQSKGNDAALHTCIPALLLPFLLEPPILAD